MMKKYIISDAILEIVKQQRKIMQDKIEKLIKGAVDEGTRNRASEIIEESIDKILNFLENY